MFRALRAGGWTSKPKLTVIVGAGFSQALGIAGTSELTDAARTLRLPAVNLGAGAIGVPLAGVLWKALSGYYNSPNFETMVHGAEALLAAQTGVPGATIPDILRPVNNAFMDVSPRWKALANSGDLIDLASNILSVVAHRVAQDAKNAPMSLAYNRAKKFIKCLTSNFDVTFVTLNYDDALDALLPDAIDGFSPGDGAEFSWSSLRAVTSAPRLLHMHGSVRFGVRTTPKRPGVIVKFQNSENAAAVGKYVIDLTLPSGDRTFIGPIITGLRKADKTLWAPYCHYLQCLAESLFSARRVVAIGYGAGDSHINSWLLQWYHLHGSLSRYVAIDKFEDIADIADDARVFAMPGAVMGFETTNELKRFAATHPREYRDRVLMVNGAMIDGNGMPDSSALGRILRCLEPHSV